MSYSIFRFVEYLVVGPRSEEVTVSSSGVTAPPFLHFL